MAGRQQTALLNYEDLQAICRLFVFIDIGASIKSNLVPDDPWTALDDIDHIRAVSNHPVPANIHKIGNLTFLPPTINKSIKDMTWPDKKEIYALLASPHRLSSSSFKFSDGRDLPPAVVNYLSDPHTPALAHLGALTDHANWDEGEITARTELVLKAVWNVFYNQWLH